MTINIAFCLFIYLGTAGLYKGDEYLIFNSFTQRALLGFFVGCFTFQVAPLLATNRNLSLIFQTLFIVGAALSIVLSRKFGFEKFFGKFDIVFALVVYPSVILFSLCNRAAEGVLTLAPLRILGECSYSIYLWHYSIQTVLHVLFLRNGISPETHLAWFVYVACVLTIAIPSYYFFEHPMQKKIRAIFRRRSIAAT